MRTKKAILKAGVVLGGLALALQASADNVAFQTPVNVLSTFPAGAQGITSPSGSFNLAMEFTVVNAIVVTQLGAFDPTIGNTGSGFVSAVQVGIYSEDNGSMAIPAITFGAGNTGTVVGSSRFQAITPVTLNPGTYQIVASGYGQAGSAVPNWNYYFYAASEDPSAPAGDLPANPLIFDGNGGDLSLAGDTSFYSESATFDDPSTATDYTQDFFADQYAAGTFAFTPVPEPNAYQFALLGACVLGLAKIARKVRKAKSSQVA
jgi:hypothetical protein